MNQISNTILGTVISVPALAAVLSSAEEKNIAGVGIVVLMLIYWAFAAAGKIKDFIDRFNKNNNPENKESND